MLKSMYSKLQARVKNRSNTFSNSYCCNIGTRQGDLSSPIIFSLYINDLCNFIRENCRNGIFITQEVPDIFCLMYADDIANCADTAVNLQSQLNCIERFCKETGMCVNLKKTEIIVFRNRGTLRNYEKLFYGGNPVSTTSVYKYMGILFTPALSWSSAKSKLANQARKAIFSIKGYQKSFGTFTHIDMLKLFDSMIVPILTYGSEIWGFKEAEEIERIQISFVNIF